MTATCALCEKRFKSNVGLSAHLRFKHPTSKLTAKSIQSQEIVNHNHIAKILEEVDELIKELNEVRTILSKI